MSRQRLLSILTLAITLAAAWVWAALQPEPIALVPSQSGQIEYCLTCHADLPEISPSHPIKTYGCVSCHGGERLALDADLAHSSMRGGRNPSDLAVVEASCGGESCHSGSTSEQRDHIQRVRKSIQATYAGAIANINFTFGGQPDLTPRYGIFAVQNSDFHAGDAGVSSLAAFDPPADSNPAILKFAGNCLVCHLTAAAPSASVTVSWGTTDPVEPSTLPTSQNEHDLPTPGYARLTGCAACHTPTAGTKLDQELHTLTTANDYRQCNTCHNRGNYDLRGMQFVPRSDHPTSRIEDYYQPIAQFTRCEWTLDCIDCHTREQAMGDGTIQINEIEANTTRCYTCHGTLAELPQTLTLSDPNDLAFRLASLNPVLDLQIGDTILVSERGERFWNARLLADGTYELFGKASGERFTFRPVIGSGCEQKLDEQESSFCHACHAVER